MSVTGRTLDGAVWVDPPPTDPPTTEPDDPEPTIGTDHLWLAHGTALMGYRLDTACPARHRTGCAPPAWVRTLDGRPTRVVVGDDGVIHVATDGGTLYALDGPTGGVLWSTGLGDGALTKPALAGGRLYVAGASRTFAVDAITGDVLWRSTASTGAPTASPVVAGDVVYSATGATGVLSGLRHGRLRVRRLRAALDRHGGLASEPPAGGVRPAVRADRERPRRLPAGGLSRPHAWGGRRAACAPAR